MECVSRTKSLSSVSLAVVTPCSSGAGIGPSRDWPARYFVRSGPLPSRESGEGNCGTVGTDPNTTDRYSIFLEILR